MDTLGDVIRQARKARKLSQGAFGKHWGLSQSIVSRYETGQVEPPPDVMYCMYIVDPNSTEWTDALPLTVGAALIGVHQASDALQRALDRLERPAISNRDTAPIHPSNSPIARESQLP